MDEWVTERPRRRAPRRRVALPPREMRRLIQLGVCVGLFLLLFVGRGAFPSGIAALREDVLQVINAKTDFAAVFSELGKSIRAGEPVIAVIGDFWGQMLGGEGRGVPDETVVLTPPGGTVADGETEPPVVETQSPAETEPPLDTEPLPVETEPEPTTSPSEQTAQPEPEPEPSPSPAPPAYTGPALPANATMERVTLGLNAVVTPVNGVISSGYGYRDHPIDGDEKFHYGVDIFAEKGQPVLAFAEGVVDFIGESPVYGLYIQIRHPNNVTSFYAHCDSLLLGQGKSVSAGQKIATVGESGNVTGPHLHLEIRKDNVFCDPAQYLELS